MINRKVYIEKLSQKLKSWDNEISKLELKAKESSAKAKVNINERLEELRLMRSNIEKRIDGLKSSSDNAWSEIKEGVEKIEDEIKETINNVKNNF